MIEKLRTIQKEVFGPGTLLFEVYNDQNLLESYHHFESETWWIKRFSNNHPLKKWIDWKIDEEQTFREGQNKASHIKAIKDRAKKHKKTF